MIPRSSTPGPQDVIQIEAHARALRAAMLRDAVRGLVARVRRTPHAPHAVRHV